MFAHDVPSLAVVFAGVYFQPLVSIRFRGYKNWVGIQLTMHELVVLPIRPRSRNAPLSPQMSPTDILRQAVADARQTILGTTPTASPSKRVKTELSLDFDD